MADASRLFGHLKTFVLREDRIDEAPEVSIVSNRPKLNDGKPLVQAKHWHTDDSYLAAPATLTLLYAKTLPKDGGDTEFINCYDVLDALPAAMRSRVANLRAVHKYLSRRNASWVAERSAEEEAETPEVDHPMIRTHPLSGRQSLYINPNRIVRIAGWSDETMPLDGFMIRSTISVRHKWRYGDRRLGQPLHDAPRQCGYDIDQPRVMRNDA